MGNMWCCGLIFNVLTTNWGTTGDVKRDRIACHVIVGSSLTRLLSRIISHDK